MLDKLKALLVICYVLFIAIVPIYSTITQTQPALFLIEIFAPNPGDKFSVTLVVLLLILIFLIPMVIVLLIARLIRLRKVETIDPKATGILVIRPKVLKNALLGVPIYINGKKAGMVDNGRSKFFEIPTGEFTLRAGIGPSASKTFEEKLSHGRQLRFMLSASGSGLHIKYHLEQLEQKDSNDS